MLQSCGCRMFSFLSDLLRWFGQWSSDPAVRPTGGFQVTRRRSGTRSARVSWTRHSAERRSPRDAPAVGGWESCGRRGREVRRPLPEPATDRGFESVSHPSDISRDWLIAREDAWPKRDGAKRTARAEATDFSPDSHGRGMRSDLSAEIDRTAGAQTAPRFRPEPRPGPAGSPPETGAPPAPASSNTGRRSSGTASGARGRQLLPPRSSPGPASHRHAGSDPSER